MLIVIQLIRNGDMACTGILVVFLMKARVCDNMRATEIYLKVCHDVCVCVTVYLHSHMGGEKRREEQAGERQRERQKLRKQKNKCV